MQELQSAMEETLMAKYTAKLVDRTSWSEADKHGIRTKAQELFDEAFQGTPDGVSVSWGGGTPSDNLVAHFVRDIPNLYLKQKWPQARIDSKRHRPYLYRRQTPRWDGGLPDSPRFSISLANVCDHGFSRGHAQFVSLSGCGLCS